MFPVILLGIVLAVGGGVMVQNNPVLFGRTVYVKEELDVAMADFRIITHHHILETILKHHQADELGDDITAYQNHCLRVLSIAEYFCREDGGEPATDRMVHVMAIALAYHDLDLWMKNGHMDYLQPSADLSMKELKIEGQQELFGIEPELSDIELNVITEIILQHHKLTQWNDTVTYPEFNKQDIIMINAIRKGDWTDFTFGLIRFGLPSKYLYYLLKNVPESGFHNILLGMGNRLSPKSLPGQLDILKIFKW